MKPDATQIICRFPREEDLEPAAVERLSELINRVYDEAESGMWRAKGTRTSPRQVDELLRKQALILAEYDGRVVGSVNINLMEARVAELGMLVADPAFRRKGIGTALIKAAEDWGVKMKCDIMRLELLTPRSWTHPSKEFLKRWYDRIGYQPQFTEAFEKLHADKVAALATECNFTVWQKNLSGAGGQADPR